MYLDGVEQSGNGPAGRNFMTFSAEDMMRAATTKGYRQEKREYPYTAQPLCKRTPEENAPWHIVQSRINCDACGCKSAHRFKVGIEVV